MSPVRAVRALPGLLVVPFLAGCPTSEPPAPLLDTGWFDSDDPPAGCGGEVLATDPAAGEASVPVHATLSATVRGPEGLEDVSAQILVTETGEEIPVAVTTEPDTLAVVITPQTPLRPSHAHDLFVRTCAGALRVSFVTSAFGAPLVDGPSALRGRTWALELADADWVEPAGVSGLFRANIDAPVLVGVQWADARALDLLGAQGAVDAGKVVQDPDLATWALPNADFARSPRFSAFADRVVLDILGVSVPVEGFTLEGTFSADGARIGDGALRGRLDTRDAGALLQAGDRPDAVCNLASTVGLSCIPCADGLPFCMDADLRDLGGVEIEGIRLVPVAP